MNTAAKPPAGGPAPSGPPFPHPGPDFAKNIAQLPPAELRRWANRHVAWSWDGKRIIAGAETLAELMAELHRTEVDPSTVVFDFIEAPEA